MADATDGTGSASADARTTVTIDSTAVESAAPALLVPSEPAAAEAKRGGIGGVVDSLRTRLREAKRRRIATRGPGGKGLFFTLVATLLLLLTTFTACLAFLFGAPDGRKVTLDQFAALVEGGRVEKAVYLDQESQFVADLRSVEAARALQSPPDEDANAKVDGVPDGYVTVRTAVPSSGTAYGPINQALQEANPPAEVSVDPQVSHARTRLVATFLLPVVILANLFALLFVGKGGAGGALGDVMSFGRVDDGSLAGATSVTFADVGGADEAVVELAEVRDYLKNPDKYRALGAAPPKGVLLFGPPGTGKTLLARAVAGEAGVPFFSVAGAEFVESLVGVGAARIRDLFKRVRAVAPAILFIDELDAAGRKRGTGGGGGGSDEREQTLNQLLVEMDGFEVTSGIVVMAATNRPDILDPALMRPGRFDRHITVERPELEGRIRILKIHARKKPLAADVDLERIAQRCPGFTGADLASVVNEAALLTIRRGGTEVGMRELEEAVVRVLEGPQRRGRVLTPEERLRAAYHEMGHVVVGAALGRLEDLHRVTILGRGRTVAAATFADAEATILTRSALHDQMVAMLGGVAAEELVLGEGSTGGEQDIEHATDLARDMVTRYGMSDEIGRVRLQVKAGEGFLGDESSLVDLSPETQREVEKAVRKLVESAQDEATAVLQAHRAELDSLAALLDEQETLEDAALHQALEPLMGRLQGKPEPTAGAPRQRKATRVAAAASTRPAPRATARTARSAEKGTGAKTSKSSASRPTSRSSAGSTASTGAASTKGTKGTGG